MNINHAELSTVLAALRYWQERIAGQDMQSADGMLDEIATDGGTVEPLNAEQIDALCERLNNGEYDGPNYIAISGGPNNGFTFYGPFEDEDTAVKFADHYPGWWVARLENRHGS